MAEVSNATHSHQQTLSSTAMTSRGGNVLEEEEEGEAAPNVDAVEFDSLSPPGISLLIPSKNGDCSFTSVSEPELGAREFEAAHSDDNFFIGPEEEGVDEYDEQMNFVTDLFGMDQALPHETNASAEEEPELVLGLGCHRDPSPDGLRVVDMDSESDCESLEVDSGVVRGGMGGTASFWNWLQLSNETERASLGEEFEWEEVNIRDNPGSLIDRIEHLSVSSFGEVSDFVTSGEAEEEEGARNVEWQVLLAINNLESGLGFEEIGELVDGESTLRGRPPAAKSVVECLPSASLAMEDLVEDSVVCAVCKDEISVGVKATKLPCCHLYHED